MKEAFKKGFGFITGMIIGKVIISVTAEKLIKKWANDDKKMSEWKERNPDLYEKFVKYRTKKSEEGEKS